MLEKQVQEAMKAAMKAKDQARLGGLRAIRAALLNAKTEKGAREMGQEDEIALLQKLAKQRKESIAIYQEQGRNDLAQPEQAELAVIESFLPAQMDNEALEKALQQIIAETGASSVKDMGKVMGLAKQRLSGKADSQRIGNKVKSMLSV